MEEVSSDITVELSDTNVQTKIEFEKTKTDTSKKEENSSNTKVEDKKKTEEPKTITHPETKKAQDTTKEPDLNIVLGYVKKAVNPQTNEITKDDLVKVTKQVKDYYSSIRKDHDLVTDEASLTVFVNDLVNQVQEDNKSKMVNTKSENSSDKKEETVTVEKKEEENTETPKEESKEEDDEMQKLIKASENGENVSEENIKKEEESKKAESKENNKEENSSPSEKTTFEEIVEQGANLKTTDEVKEMFETLYQTEYDKNTEVDFIGFTKKALRSIREKTRPSADKPSELIPYSNSQLGNTISDWVKEFAA
jgi:hypothetical protein